MPGRRSAQGRTAPTWPLSPTPTSTQSGPSPDDVKGAVLALMDELAPEMVSTNAYVLDRVIQLQSGNQKLPFYDFRFTRPDYLHMPRGNVNRPHADVTVRVGGTDLAPGEAELVDFSCNDYVWGNTAQTFKKPDLSSIPGLNIIGE